MRRGLAAALAALALGGAGEAATAPRVSAEAPFVVRREGEPVTLRLRLENDGPAGTFTLRARSSYAGLEAETVGSVELAAGARKTAWLLAETPREHLLVTLESSGGVVAETSLAVEERPWSVPLVGLLGPGPAGLSRATLGEQGLVRRASFVELRPEALPPEPLLWPALDAVIWPAPLAHELSPRTAAALRNWVARGGRLIAGRNPEDPDALAALGLERAPGWGRVDGLDEDLRGAPAARLVELLELRAEPPSARTYGPWALLRGVVQRADRLVRPPLVSSSLVIAGTLAGLTLLPALRRRRARKGLPLRARRVPPVAVLLLLACAASLLVVLGGRSGPIALVRLDLIDVDAATGRQRAESFLTVRRGRPGSLELDTRGLARLAFPLAPTLGAPTAGLRLERRLGLDGSSLEGWVGTWESLPLRVTWSPEALAPRPLPGGPESVLASLGADFGRLWHRGRFTTHGERTAPDESALELARQYFSSQSRRGWSATADSDWQETGDRSVRADEQWAWPATLRWRGSRDDRVLVAVTEGAAGPPVLVDGRPAPADEAWTIWRVRTAPEEAR